MAQIPKVPAKLAKRSANASPGASQPTSSPKRGCAPIPYKSRPLRRRRAQTVHGTRVLVEARALAKMPEYMHLSDAELIRLAYWGSSGDVDLEGREKQRAMLE
jgi:hypothetical protein